jgi:D-alanyl-D-alanine carboxypeptidase/D-alanyl-D-alanine-endopeptidase (penicillin-binding protein 4)
LQKLAVLLWLLAAVIPATAGDTSVLVQRIQQVAARPVFRHSAFGVEVYDQTAGTTLVAINPEELFTSGSTTKLVTEGVALALLGENYRFRTRVYYTGNIAEDGTLEGNLVLVAGGDPNLSGRVLPDDTLDYAARDHAYAGLLPGKSVAGEPLRVMKELAAGVLMKGIWRVRGHVIVDASLFPSDQVEPATHTTISPVVLNDNVIDVVATSAPNVGGPVAIQIAPEMQYLKVINKVRTGKPDSDPEMQFTSDNADADGLHTVVLEGSVPAGRESAQAAYKVKDPVRFATEGFREALRWAGIVLEPPPASESPAAEPDDSQPRTLLVEHLSAPFKEEVKLTLKVSQNLHAATTPYLVGSLLGHASIDAPQKGLALERRFLAEAGLNPETISQLDGEGGVGSAFSPHFMVRYLDVMSHRPYGRWFYECLPVLGRDGTLAETLTDSPAAGHVHAKTGSYVVSNTLDGGVMLLGKGLAGYVDAANGHRLIFAVFVNMVALRNMDDVSDVGQMLAEVAALAYQYPSPATAAPKVAAPNAATAKKKPASSATTPKAASSATSKPETPKAVAPKKKPAATAPARKTSRKPPAHQ